MNNLYWTSKTEAFFLDIIHIIYIDSKWSSIDCWVVGRLFIIDLSHKPFCGRGPQTDIQLSQYYVPWAIFYLFIYLLYLIIQSFLFFYKRYGQHSTKLPTLDSTNFHYQNVSLFKYLELSSNFLHVVFTFNLSCYFDGEDSVL